jgi:hypothetical protein
MIFQPRDQFERSQAIDFQLLVKIVRRRKLVAWNLKMLRGQAQNLVGGLFDGLHASYFTFGSLCARLRHADYGK